MIEMHGITKSFGPVHAVDGLSLTVRPGEIVALLGPNGAGKTTTIDMILGLTSPTKGRLRILERTPREAVHEGRIGALMQTGGLLGSMTVQETLTSIAALCQRTSRVGEVIARARLEHLAKRRVAKCSGGEQQRIKFALALLPDPQLLVLDEPTTGMDAAARRELWAWMHGEAANGRTILFATHYLEEAQDFAQRIVLLGRGRLLADDSVAKIRSLASGRQVEATLPMAEDGLLARLRSLPSVSATEANGRRVTVTTIDSDGIARLLLDSGGTDLLVSSPTLESAFVALTKDNR